MKILVVYPGQFFPKTMASHDRVIEMVRCLARAHQVHVAFLTQDPKSRRVNEVGIRKLGAIPVLVRQPFRSFVGRKMVGAAFMLASWITGIERQYFYCWNFLIAIQLWRHLRGETYDAIQMEFCYQASLFRHIGAGTLKVLDTIDVLYEKRQLEAVNRHGAPLPWYAKRQLNRFKAMELIRAGLADVIISISGHDFGVFREHFPNKQHLLVPMGLEMGPFHVNTGKHDNNTILFYGNMGSEQNVLGFWRFWNGIYPLVVEKLGGFRPRVLVVGASPSTNILALHDNKMVIVTGFVSDVRPWLEQSSVLCVPLDIAGGFRGRVLEVLATGIPVVGTHNALDCIQLKDGIHGFVADENERMADGLVRLLSQPGIQAEMGHACRKLAEVSFSIEATYGQLSKFYTQYVAHQYGGG